jgi:hypothetical protein
LTDTFQTGSPASFLGAASLIWARSAKSASISVSMLK